ncbi:hypothetical protein B0H10DRAFT_2209405 [Mycena sp. CBHHK59/15]|nr:hypothetical protein B0H10DRAFT_2209405 [Mycena sp. CBHHK59/15]
MSSADKAPGPHQCKLALLPALGNYTHDMGFQSRHKLVPKRAQGTMYTHVHGSMLYYISPDQRVGEGKDGGADEGVGRPPGPHPLHAVVPTERLRHDPHLLHAQHLCPDRRAHETIPTRALVTWTRRLLNTLCACHVVLLISGLDFVAACPPLTPA